MRAQPTTMVETSATVSIAVVMPFVRGFVSEEPLMRRLSIAL